MTEQCQKVYYVGTYRCLCESGYMNIFKDLFLEWSDFRMNKYFIEVKGLRELIPKNP